MIKCFHVGMLLNTHHLSVALQDLFFNYQWNNFLHTYVEQCINSILSSDVGGEDSNSKNPLVNNVSLAKPFSFLIICSFDVGRKHPLPRSIWKHHEPNSLAKGEVVLSLISTAYFVNHKRRNHRPQESLIVGIDTG